MVSIGSLELLQAAFLFNAKKNLFVSPSRANPTHSCLTTKNGLKKKSSGKREVCRWQYLLYLNSTKDIGFLDLLAKVEVVGQDGVLGLIFHSVNLATG